MPLHVASSHFVTTDILAGLVSALVLLAAAAVADEGNHRHYRCLGLLCGLAGAAKYNALLVALNLPLAHWLNHRRERFFDWRLLRACGWLAAGFLVACPYALLDLPAFLDGLAMEVFHYREGHVGHEGEHNRTFYLLYLASRGFGPVLTGLGIFGLIAMSWQRERRHTLLVAFPVLYVIFLGSYKVRFVRNLMPALPYFSLWIGFGASQAFRLVRQSWPALGRVRAWKLTVPALALIVAIPLAMSLDETVARIEPDTRLEAKRWMERALPRGSTVYAQAWSVDNLAPGRFRISQDRWSWDYYVATDRLSRKYFAMKKRAPEKYAEVVEAFKHRPVAVFPGREENPFDSTASPTVLIFAREPARSRVRPPPAPVLPSPAPAPAAPSAAPVPAGAGRPQAGSSP